MSVVPSTVSLGLAQSRVEDINRELADLKLTHHRLLVEQAVAQDEEKAAQDLADDEARSYNIARREWWHSRTRGTKQF